MKTPRSWSGATARRRLLLATLPALSIAPLALAATTPATPAQLAGNWRAIDAESETTYAVVEFVQTPPVP